jgi:predicted GNAT family acetyltransferase
MSDAPDSEALVELHDRGQIEVFLRAEPQLHLYAIGDLDDFFWPDTDCFGLIDGGRLREFALLYRGGISPTLQAFASGSTAAMVSLLDALLPRLPASFEAHLSEGLAGALLRERAGTARGAHCKMALRDPSRLTDWRSDAIENLSREDLAELRDLYAESYPGNWFDERMLATGYYYGIRRGGRLVSVSGVHVVSHRHRVAALGNVTTHPAHRGQGLATLTCAHLCRALLERVDEIGANVKADNHAALACYERLGFCRYTLYEEWHFESRS